MPSHIVKGLIETFCSNKIISIIAKKAHQF